MAVLWSPGGGKRISLVGDYSRLMLRSDIFYLEPDSYRRALSAYRDYAHNVNSLLTVNVSRLRLGLGGAFFLSSGSRPSDYHQPLGQIAVPLLKHVEFRGQWRWHQLSQIFYPFEGFRTHLFEIGLRITP